MIYVKIYENNSFTTKHDRKLEADGKVPAGDIAFAITLIKKNTFKTHTHTHTHTHT